jgi:hypothetical protein
MSTWRHSPGDTYLPMQCQAWMNESGHGFHYSRLGEPTRHEAAVKVGLRALGSDDFNIGVIRRGRLVAILWMGEVVDDDPALMDEIAGQVGLR